MRDTRILSRLVVVVVVLVIAVGGWRLYESRTLSGSSSSTTTSTSAVVLAGSANFCHDVTSMQTTLDEIAALPVASNPSNAQVASYVSLLKDFASQVSSATALSPGGVVSSDLGSVTTSLSALVGSPSALGVARGSTQSDPTLATDAYVVTNASNAFTAMWGDLGKSCSGLTSNQSLLAPSK